MGRMNFTGCQLCGVVLECSEGVQNLKWGLLINVLFVDILVVSIYFAVFSRFQFLWVDKFYIVSTARNIEIIITYVYTFFNQLHLSTVTLVKYILPKTLYLSLS